MEPRMPRGKCAICGKDVPIRSTRDRGDAYCSRSHEVMGKRFGKRYKGTNSGPMDRPDLLKKTQEL